jgi:hypothetical protein
MSNQSYTDASDQDKQHFMKCGGCSEWIDCCDLDEVCSHEIDHEPHPDIQYSGSAKIQ